MANNTSAKRKTQQRQAVIRIVILAAILICINMLAARFHTGVDLTKEKRFTLTEPTKRFLRDMKDIAVIEIYLKSDELPGGLQRLSNVIKERLESFKSIAGSKIVYRFTDPFEGKAENEKQPIFEELAKKGIQPINLQVKIEEGYSEKLIFPYALVRYNGKEMPVRLLENNMSMGGFENISYSEALLEYKIADAINKLSVPARPTIGYIVGNGEELGVKTIDLLTTLEQSYKVDTIDLVNSTHISSVYNAIIICKPTIPFDEQEKFKIDQYVMKGGRVLWALDVLHASMDSLRASQQFMAMDYGLQLDDQLFKYGVRINSNLVEDMSCNQIPITVGMSGTTPQIQLRPWIYFPIIIPTANHSIVKNMDAVMCAFVSSIDTIASPDIKKTILLTSSKYSRIAETPVRVSLSMLNYPVEPQMFSKGYQPVAVLSEGKFTSVFQNRLHPSFLKTLRDSLKQPFKPAVDSAGSMIFIADGDILLNDFSSTMGPMPMGYWQFTKERFANKTFVLNCIEYLVDKSGLLEARSKEVKLRLLDGTRMKKEKTKWQVLNIGIPIALILIFASAYLFFRKRRYEK